MDNFIIGSGIIFLVPFFTNIGVVAPLKNDPILSGRSIRSFRHLELKNPSITSDFRHSTRMVQQFPRSRRSRRSSRRRSTVLLEDVIILFYSNYLIVSFFLISIVLINTTLQSYITISNISYPLIELYSSCSSSSSRIVAPSWICV